MGELHAAGVERDDVALLMAEDQHSPRFRLVAGHKLAEGVAFGSALGATLGLVIGAVVALADLTAVGTMIAALAGAGFGGGIGSIIGAVIGLGAPNYTAKLAAESSIGCPILVAVWVDDDARARRIAQILAR